jgi:hypothetical protein
MSENRMLRRIFGPKKAEVTGGWKKLHNEEFHKFLIFTKYFSIFKLRMRGAGACSTHGGDEKCVQNSSKKT